MAGAGWHLPQLAPRPWAPSCLCFELLTGGVWSSHMGFCSPRLASKRPVILKSSPGSRSWVARSLAVTMAAVSVFPLPRWDTAVSWVLSSPVPRRSPGTGAARTSQKRQDYPAILSFLIDLTVLQTFPVPGNLQMLDSPPLLLGGVVG